MNSYQIPTVTVPIVRFSESVDLELPQYATELSSGVDLVADINEELIIKSGARMTISTGIGIELPYGFEAQVRSRSGLAAKNGIMVLNSPGTIDADYRGEIKVILYNTDDTDFVISRGMKIAQLVIAPIAKLIWQENKHIGETKRGQGGFGSTGI
ncbi:MAG: dUTP diphosphatase [Alphaproteobacteria bacterium]